MHVIPSRADGEGPYNWSNRYREKPSVILRSHHS